MSGESVAALRKTAEEVAAAAGALLKEKFTQARTVEKKGGIDLVTDADKAAEALILSAIHGRYPAHAVLAEESGYQAGKGLRWIIDPLDGTTNYAHRVPHFCVSIAVDSDDGLLAGAIFDPIRDELFSAGKGDGATLNGETMRASSSDDLGEALLCTGFPYDVRERPEAPVGLFNRLIKRARGIRRAGSAALDLAYVAAGRYDGFFEFRLKAWDIAAGALLIEEAGGKVTRIDGQPLDLAKGDVLAASAALYPTLYAETDAFLAEIGVR